VLRPGDLLLIDEAGMLDQDTARAILDLAARWARPETVVPLDVVHRFTEPQYAELSLAMRPGVRAGEVFDSLVEAYQVRLNPPRPSAPRHWPTSLLTAG
jgi:exodeoxyribonuclease V alpha subunit